ncbi:hypothetical protein HRbin02_00981 [Candidatus Calditenuaceae archaeon HR02]|nr:hypothetical protein HRbin02_00981 [Candidatus Calditenuaceae archaeon HR02]
MFINYLYHSIRGYTIVSHPITIKVKTEVLELAEKMVRYGIARSRSHAINLMIERGMEKAVDEVKFWEDLHNGVERLRRSGYRIRHGGLGEILREGRAKR